MSIVVRIYLSFVIDSKRTFISFVNGKNNSPLVHSIVRINVRIVYSLHVHLRLLHARLTQFDNWYKYFISIIFIFILFFVCIQVTIFDGNWNINVLSKIRLRQSFI